MSLLRFVTYDPGHFHAALVQKEMYDGVDPIAHIYAPLGPDLLAHLQRIAGFNRRPQDPTDWKLEVHAGPHALQRMIAEKAGDIAIFAGRNATKIDAILAAAKAGFHILADKPWVIRSEDLPKLDQALDVAASKGRIAYDIMTERHEITSILQRSLVGDSALFGEPLPGTWAEPTVHMESVHYLKKTVAGAPLRRPAWFFDVREQGNALADVGTHLVDLSFWLLFPDQTIEPRDVQVVASKTWPTMVPRDAFRAITDEADFPQPAGSISDGNALHYPCNTQVNYLLRGLKVRLDVLWRLEAKPGEGDTHHAILRGSKSRIEVRQGAAENGKPEVYVVPAPGKDLKEAMRSWVQRTKVSRPGIDAIWLGTEYRLAIPEHDRVGHEAHFAEVTRHFLRMVRGETPMPPWESANMRAKYAITTRAGAC